MKRTENLSIKEKIKYIMDYGLEIIGEERCSADSELTFRLIDVNGEERRAPKHVHNLSIFYSLVGSAILELSQFIQKGGDVFNLESLDWHMVKQIELIFYYTINYLPSKEVYHETRIHGATNKQLIYDALKIFGGKLTKK